MKGGAEGYGVGHSVRRKEDDRYMRGKGEFVGDIKLAGMRELAFVRSPLAHARIQNIRKPAGQENSVFVAADLIGIKPIVANSGLPGFKSSAQPILAHDKVRHVGEAIAAGVVQGFERITVLLPYEAGRLVSLFHEKGHVEKLEHEEAGVRITGLLPVQLLSFFEEYVE